MPEYPPIKEINRAIVLTSVNIELLDEISKYDWPVDVAYEVATAESGGKVDAYNPEWHKGCQGSYSYFQVACIHGTKADLQDGKKNVEIAYKLWKIEGWRPWSVCLNGTVKCF